MKEYKDKTDMLSSLKKVNKGFIDEKMEWYGVNSIEKLSEKIVEEFKEILSSAKNDIFTQMFFQRLVNNENSMIFSAYDIDDGYSGTSFNRPAFKRLLENIRDKKVNAIIVKDLSRFGRNHIEVDNYIENIFPVLNVRFISIIDGFDSYENSDGVDDLIVPIKNLINDAYAKDISKKKVKTALITKKKNGEFVGSYATYGYCKSRFDKHKFIIDEEASKIVKIIFEKTINGLSKKEIANILNEMKIETLIEHIKNKKENFFRISEMCRV